MANLPQKGAESQFVGTCTLHLSCSPSGPSSQCPHRSMMILLIFLRMVPHNKGFVSCLGLLCKIGYLSAPRCSASFDISKKPCLIAITHSLHHETQLKSVSNVPVVTDALSPDLCCSPCSPCVPQLVAADGGGRGVSASLLRQPQAAAGVSQRDQRCRYVGSQL